MGLSVARPLKTAIREKNSRWGDTHFLRCMAGAKRLNSGWTDRLGACRAIHTAPGLFVSSRNSTFLTVLTRYGEVVAPVAGAEPPKEDIKSSFLDLKRQVSAPSINTLAGSCIT